MVGSPDLDQPVIPGVEPTARLCAAPFGHIARGVSDRSAQDRALSPLSEPRPSAGHAHQPGRRPPRREARQRVDRGPRAALGLGLRAGQSTADDGLTWTGDVLGTPRYRSPEQAMVCHDLMDHRTGVYALGATLYELITGRPAVGGASRTMLSNFATQDPVGPRKLNSQVPVDLETVVLKCLRKDPMDRYQSRSEESRHFGTCRSDKSGRFLGMHGSISDLSRSRSPRSPIFD